MDMDIDKLYFKKEEKFLESCLGKFKTLRGESLNLL